MFCNRNQMFQYYCNNQIFVLDLVLLKCWHFILSQYILCKVAPLLLQDFLCMYIFNTISLYGYVKNLCGNPLSNTKQHLADSHIKKKSKFCLLNFEANRRKMSMPLWCVYAYNNWTCCVCTLYTIQNIGIESLNLFFLKKKKKKNSKRFKKFHEFPVFLWGDVANRGIYYFTVIKFWPICETWN